MIVKLVKILAIVLLLSFIAGFKFVNMGISVKTEALQNSLDYPVLDTLDQDSSFIPEKNRSVFINIPDSFRQDSIMSLSDTSAIELSDSASGSENVIDSPIDYIADDSIVYMLNQKKVFLYKNGKINYQDIELTADFIMINLEDNSVFAKGLPDSTGEVVGKPVFKEGEETFQAKEMTYNFKTKKGYIVDVMTPQADGYLHSHITKRQANEQIHIRNGKYTTCDKEHPHFYVAITKGIMIPEEKIVSKWAYLVLADVPLPVGIPFGFFPNQTTNTSGVLIPEYGEEQRRGFFLRNGGYYFAINDYMDLTLRGDIYSRGSWGLSAASTYKKKYRYSGNFSIKYYENKTGDKDLPDFSNRKDFSVRWTHSQDAKANPKSSFSANVDFSSTSFDKNQTFSANNYLNTTKSSSISYSRKLGSEFNFSSNLRHTQNSNTKSVDLTLPSMTLSMNRQYPFERKNTSGDKRWYEKIEVRYNAKLDNKINTVDSLLFREETLDQMRNGFQHDIPVSVNFKALKFFNITPRINYTGRVYTNHIEKAWDESYYDASLDSTYAKLVTDTIQKFSYVHDYSSSFSISANPKIYGMFYPNPKIFGEKIVAVRHMMSPSASFSFTPDLDEYKPDYYRTVQSDTAGNTTTYSIYEKGLYGYPSGQGRSAKVNLSLGNNIEMKVKQENDTSDTESKVKILENLSLSTSYDIYKDSMNWSNITFSGNTNLFNKNVTLRFGGTLDPYALTEDGVRYNEAVYKTEGKLARLTLANIDIGFSLKPQSNKQKNENIQAEGVVGDYYEDYIDWNIPWNLRVNYGWKYSKPKFESTKTQTLRISGDLSITKKWKIGFSSGYDFEDKEITSTNLNIYRDLHCWEMRLTAIPFGTYKSYSFQINVKSSILKDLKWQKNQSWYDNF